MSEGDPELLAVAEKLFPRYGYSVLGCSFIALKDLTFKWGARGNGLKLQISDYLRGAPVPVLEDFINGALAYTKTRRMEFGSEFVGYVKTDGFVLKNRPLYMSRARSITQDGHGKVRSIYDSVDRLMDAGLVFPSDIDNTVFVWTKKPTRTRLGYCCTMVRFIVISSVFDDPEIDQRTFDYVVYHEIIHNRIGFRPFDRHPHDAAFKRYERMFPELKTVNDIIKRTVANKPANKKHLKG